MRWGVARCLSARQKCVGKRELGNGRATAFAFCLLFKSSPKLRLFFVGEISVRLITYFRLLPSDQIRISGPLAEEDGDVSCMVLIVFFYHSSETKQCICVDGGIVGARHGVCWCHGTWGGGDIVPPVLSAAPILLSPRSYTTEDSLLPTCYWWFICTDQLHLISGDRAYALKIAEREEAAARREQEENERYCELIRVV